MEVKFSTPAQHTSEEVDELHCSVNKFKESSGARSFLQPKKLVSYKDSLVGDILGAYEQAFKFSKDWEDGYDLEVEMEPLTEGMVEVKLSKETKVRIRAPWSKALIIKVYGWSVGFNYLTFKINALWKPTAKMDCVTLGRGFFLIHLSCNDDFDKESCGLKLRKPSGEDATQVLLKTNEISEEAQPEPNYGPWMVITRKRGQVMMGKASGPIKFGNPSHVRVRSNSDLSQVSAHVEAGKDFDKSNPSDLNASDPATSREVTTCAVAAQNLQSDSADSRDEEGLCDGGLY
nr:hypothetical protein CFP56_06195 [Quercus suber]